jgi:hypothetical protein
VTTAAEYRQYAQDCIQSARHATADEVRHQFLDLAKLWMEAAGRMEDAEQRTESSLPRVNGPSNGSDWPVRRRSFPISSCSPPRCWPVFGATGRFWNEEWPVFLYHHDR